MLTSPRFATQVNLLPWLALRLRREGGILQKTLTVLRSPYIAFAGRHTSWNLRKPSVQLAAQACSTKPLGVARSELGSVACSFWYE